jgi:hypothetical protein
LLAITRGPRSFPLSGNTSLPPPALLSRREDYVVMVASLFTSLSLGLSKSVFQYLDVFSLTSMMFSWEPGFCYWWMTTDNSFWCYVLICFCWLFTFFLWVGRFLNLSANCLVR